MKSGVFLVLVVIGYLSMALAFVSGIGYGLYLLGAVELTFGASAWAGFLLWVKMFVGGFISLLVGYVGLVINKQLVIK